jgi:polyhydroxyalkanoate synthesis repressor PhaR
MPTTRRASAPPRTSAAKKAAAAAEPLETSGTATRVLKKYPNRRLYDTHTSSYITLHDVKKMVLEGLAFEVLDAKTSEDLTRSILLQIILEEESGGVPMFSTESLSQMIRFYGHAMQGVMGSMFEKNLQAFADMQTQFVQQSKGMLDPGLLKPAALNPESWAPFMGGQPAALQSLMSSYAEQSRAMLDKLQQAGSLFTGMPGFTPKK